MSATLSIPTLMRLEDLKAYIDIEIEKGIEKRLPAAVEKVLSNPENSIFTKMFDLPVVKEKLFALFSEFMATAETKPLKRISTVETVLGLNDFADDEVQTIPEQINLLTERIDELQSTPRVTEKPTEKKIDNSPIIIIPLLSSKPVP